MISQHINWRAAVWKPREICVFDFNSHSNVSQNDVYLLLGVEFPSSTSFWRSAKNFLTLYENVTVSTNIRTKDHSEKKKTRIRSRIV